MHHITHDTNFKPDMITYIDDTSVLTVSDKIDFLESDEYEFQ